MQQAEFNKILIRHEHWLKGWKEGKRADLYGADLSGLRLSEVNLSTANLRGADLRGADLRGANLSWADLSGAEMSKANLSETDLRKADLSDADLREATILIANLSGADLSGADLGGASLRGIYLSRADLSRANLAWADLWKADLSDANLSYANFARANLCAANFSRSNMFRVNIYGADLERIDMTGAENMPLIPYACPDAGAFIGWKKAIYCTDGGDERVIVELEIPEDARRLSGAGRKCRCDKAKVLSIKSLDGLTDYEIARSEFDTYFIYLVGEEVRVLNFDENRWNECSTGIHFFINRQEAVEY